MDSSCAQIHAAEVIQLGDVYSDLLLKYCVLFSFCCSVFVFSCRCCRLFLLLLLLELELLQPMPYQPTIMATIMAISSVGIGNHIVAIFFTLAFSGAFAPDFPNLLTPSAKRLLHHVHNCTTVAGRNPAKGCIGCIEHRTAKIMG